MILLNEANSGDIFDSQFSYAFPEYASAMESYDMSFDDADLEFESVFGMTDDDYLTEGEKMDKFKKFVGSLPGKAVDGLIKAYQFIRRLVQSVIIEMNGFYKLDGKSIKATAKRLNKRAEDKKEFKANGDVIEIALYKLASGKAEIEKFAKAKNFTEYVKTLGNTPGDGISPDDKFKAAINIVEFNTADSGSTRKFGTMEILGALEGDTKAIIDPSKYTSGEPVRSIVFVRTADGMTVSLIGDDNDLATTRKLENGKIGGILKNLDKVYNAARADKNDTIKAAGGVLKVRYEDDKKGDKKLTDDEKGKARKEYEGDVEDAKKQYAAIAGALKAIATGMMRFSSKYKPVSYDVAKKTKETKKDGAAEGETKNESMFYDLPEDIAFECTFGGLDATSSDEYVESVLDWFGSDYTTEGVLSTKIKNLFNTSFGTLEDLFTSGGAVTITRKAAENLKAKFGEMSPAKNNKKYQIMLYAILATALEKRDAKMIGDLYKAQRNHTEYRWVLDNYEKIDLSKNSYTVRFGVYEKDANIYWPAIKSFISGGANDESLESTIAKKMSGPQTVASFFMTANDGSVVFSVVDTSNKVDTFEADKNFVRTAKKSAADLAKKGGETLASFGVMFGRFLSGLKGGKIGVKAVEAKDEPANESASITGATDSDYDAFNKLFE